MSDELEKRAEEFSDYIDRLNQAEENLAASISPELQPLAQLAVQFKVNTAELDKITAEEIKQNLLTRFSELYSAPPARASVPTILQGRLFGQASKASRAGLWRKAGVYALGLVAALALIIIAVSVKLVVSPPSSTITAVPKVAATPTLLAQLTAAPMGNYTGHLDVVEALAFSPDGQTLISGDAQGTVIIWDNQGQIITKLTSTTNPLFDRLVWLPGGQNFATADLRIWDRAGQPLGQLPTGFKTYLPDGKTIALIDPAKPFQIILRSGGGRELTVPVLPNGTVTNLSFSSDGETVAIASFEKDKATPGTTAQSYGPGDIHIRLLKLDPSIGNNSGLLDFRGYNRPVMAMKFSGDGELVAVSTKGTQAEGEYARIWNRAGRLVGQLEGSYGVISTLAWSPDNRLLAGISTDNKVRIWNRSGQLLTTLTLPGNRAGGITADAVAWSPDGKVLAAGASDNTIQLWRVNY